MNKLTRTSLSKKFAVLMTVTGVSSFISLPVMAQLNPRPRIFDEPPYNRLHSPPKHHHPKHKRDPRIGERPAPPPDAGDRPPKHHPKHKLFPRIGERPAPLPVQNAPQPPVGRSYDFRPAAPPPAVPPR